MNKADQEWHDTKKVMGWELPERSPWFLRLPIVRHARWIVLGIKIDLHYAYGLGSIGIRGGYDDWALYAILRGWL